MRIVILHEALDLVGLDDQDQLEAVAKILDRVEVRDLESLQRVSFLRELEGERPFRGRR